VQINSGGFDVGMSHQLLNLKNIDTLLQKMRRETMRSCIKMIDIKFQVIYQQRKLNFVHLQRLRIANSFSRQAL
jgi:hypothetical protein